MKIGITAVGTYVPEKILTNNDLSKIVDTNDEWISSRTGIKERRIVAEGESNADIAFKAAQDLFSKITINPEEIGAVICATSTSDGRFPSTAAVVQGMLGLSHVPAFDISTACGGFIYALITAESYIKSGIAKKVLCLCPERMSTIVDWTDRNTCVLFGDGAGAFLVEENSPTSTILASSFGADGTFADALKTIDLDGKQCIRMEGSIIFKQAVRIMAEQVRLVCEKAGKTIEDIDLLVPHQANERIITAVGEKLGIDPKKAYINVSRYGNTSAATIPLALADAQKEGRLKKGDLVVTTALGGGLTWGASLIQF
ncbi:MAG: beta-ketoacyl-ACP synthase III [Brevinema sp.]